MRIRERVFRLPLFSVNCSKVKFDTSELRRVYGELTMPDESQPVSESRQPLSKTGHDISEILALKDNQITDLKAQLEKAEMRETALIDEKAKLLDLLSDTQNLLSAEKEEKKALMPPADDKPKSRNWLLQPRRCAVKFHSSSEKQRSEICPKTTHRLRSWHFTDFRVSRFAMKTMNFFTTYGIILLSSLGWHSYESESISVSATLPP